MQFSKEWFQGAFSKSYLWVVFKRFAITFLCGAAAAAVPVLGVIISSEASSLTWGLLWSWAKMLGYAAGAGGFFAVIKWWKFNLTQFSLSNNKNQ